jgi:hypothetical protein
MWKLEKGCNSMYFQNIFEFLNHGCLGFEFACQRMNSIVSNLGVALSIILSKAYQRRDWYKAFFIHTADLNAFLSRMHKNGSSNTTAQREGTCEPSCVSLCPISRFCNCRIYIGDY